MPTTNPTTPNALKKGTRIRMRNGWYGTLRDSKRGTIRLAEVEGICTELGSVYAHDIAAAEVNGAWVRVEHDAAQRKCRATVNAMFGG